MGKDGKNPADAFRKEQKKKELARNKRAREAAREANILDKDPAAMRKTIGRYKWLQEQDKLDNTQLKHMQHLERMLKLYQEKKADLPASTSAASPYAGRVDMHAIFGKEGASGADSELEDDDDEDEDVENEDEEGENSESDDDDSSDDEDSDNSNDLDIVIANDGDDEVIEESVHAPPSKKPRVEDSNVASAEVARASSKPAHVHHPRPVGYSPDEQPGAKRRREESAPTPAPAPMPSLLGTPPTARHQQNKPAQRAQAPVAQQPSIAPANVAPPVPPIPAGFPFSGADMWTRQMIAWGQQLQANILASTSQVTQQALQATQMAMPGIPMPYMQTYASTSVPQPSYPATAAPSKPKATAPATTTISSAHQPASYPSAPVPPAPTPTPTPTPTPAPAPAPAAVSKALTSLVPSHVAKRKAGIPVSTSAPASASAAALASAFATDHWDQNAAGHRTASIPQATNVPAPQGARILKVGEIPKAIVPSTAAQSSSNNNSGNVGSRGAGGANNRGVGVQNAAATAPSATAAYEEFMKSIASLDSS